MMQLETINDISIHGLSRKFAQRTVLDNIELYIPEGQFVSLLGKSGSGKSTLLRALAGLDDNVEGSGQIFISDDRSVMFQDSRLLPWENVVNNTRLGVEQQFNENDAIDMLGHVGLADRAKAWPAQLSGGEQQRVALARSLLRRPSVLLADEPFGALDALTRIKMHKLLLTLIQQIRPIVVLVTHDVEEAITLSDRILILNDGKISEDITLPHPHSRNKNRDEFEILRTHLLDNLGVKENNDALN